MVQVLLNSNQLTYIVLFNVFFADLSPIHIFIKAACTNLEKRSIDYAFTNLTVTDECCLLLHTRLLDFVENDIM